MLHVRERKRLYLFRKNRFRADLVIENYELFKLTDRPEAKPKNISADIDRIKKFFDFIRVTDVRNVTPKDFDEYKEAELTRVKPSTLHRKLNPVLAFFAWCYRRDLVQRDICAKVDNVKIKQKNEVIYLSNTEIDDLLRCGKIKIDSANQYGIISYDRQTPIHEMTAIAVYAGLRLSEILQLKKQDIKFDDNFIAVRNRQGKTIKTLKERRIPLSSLLKEILIRYYMFNEIPEGYIFRTSTGRMIHRSSARHSLKSVAKKAGLISRKANWNVLRHTFASHLVSNGVSIYKVSNWLGHSSVKTTERYYAHLIPTMFDSDIEKIYIDKDAYKNIMDKDA